MTKILFLIRHGEASAKLLNQHDTERELTTAGRRQSLEIGSYLLAEKIQIDTIITSSATRAVQTANLAADKMLYDTHKVCVEERLYEASTRTLAEVIKEFDNNLNNVAVVGHNPTLSYLAEYFTKTQVGSMATGSIAFIKFEIPSWKYCGEGNGQLVKYAIPS